MTAIRKCGFTAFPMLRRLIFLQGLELQFTDLNAGTFIQATNTIPSRTAVAGTNTTAPVIADDNRNAAINDNGGYIAFMSNRDLKPCAITPVPTDGTCGNASPGVNNDEIFLAVLNGNQVNLNQITATTERNGSTTDQ